MTSSMCSWSTAASFDSSADRLDEAAADYQEAIRSKKDPFLAHAELAHVYQKQGKTDQAIEQFTRAIALKPNWSPLYRGRAKVLQARADATPAQRAGGPVRSEDGDPLREARQSGPGPGPYQSGQAALSRRATSKTPSRRASSPCESPPTMSDAHVLQVQVLLKLRRYDEVIRSCDAALAMGKKSAVLYELRGLAHAAPRRLPRRDPGLRPSPGDPPRRRPVARSAAAGRTWSSTRPSWPWSTSRRRSSSIRPMRDAYNGRGTAHAQLGDHRAAVADAREALRLGRASPRVTYNAARIYAIAASVAAAEVGEKGRQARLLASQYQDIAVQLIRERFEREAPEKRAAFWRETIQPDPALKAIRRRLKFEELIATNKKHG